MERVDHGGGLKLKNLVDELAALDAPLFVGHYGLGESAHGLVEGCGDQLVVVVVQAERARGTRLPDDTRVHGGVDVFGQEDDDVVVEILVTRAIVHHEKIKMIQDVDTDLGDDLVGGAGNAVGAKCQRASRVARPSAT